MAKQDNELELARQAGAANFNSEPPERRTPEACPFPVGDPQREAWLDGFEEALDAQSDPVDLRRALKESRK